MHKNSKENYILYIPAVELTENGLKAACFVKDSPQVVYRETGAKKTIKERMRRDQLILSFGKFREYCEKYKIYPSEGYTRRECIAIVPNGITERKRQEILEAAAITGVTVKRTMWRSSAAALGSTFFDDIEVDDINEYYGVFSFHITDETLEVGLFGPPGDTGVAEMLSCDTYEDNWKDGFCDIVRKKMHQMEMEKSKILAVIIDGCREQGGWIEGILKGEFENARFIYKEESAVLGGAIQGAILRGEQAVGELLLLDLIPQAIRIETSVGKTAVILNKDTTIPTKKSIVCRPRREDMERVEIHLVRGNSENINENENLIRIEQEILTENEKDQEIEVEIGVDQNSEITVTTKHMKQEKIYTIDHGFLDLPEIQKRKLMADVVV